MQERHGLPLRSFSSGKVLTAGRAVRPEVAQERRYLQGAPLGLELPGRIALRDPHCAWQWFEPEAAAEAFPAAHWLAAFLVLLGRYGNEEITLGFPEPITVRGRQAPALLRSSYRAMESSAERSARLAEELDDARRQLSADGQERAALAGRCAVQVLAARPTASSPRSCEPVDSHNVYYVKLCKSFIRPLLFCAPFPLPCLVWSLQSSPTPRRLAAQVKSRTDLAAPAQDLCYLLRTEPIATMRYRPTRTRHEQMPVRTLNIAQP
ncbi:hypothetical protein SOJ72_23505 [Pseudomonas aeruginosa]|uniref:hypothetical protein n=1 Tax=Pseudomonas aeruginosa TaxID=287 RepID=UPI002A6A8ADF|nr:hypothetical protein [Pseudomonas aeruginosa]MDY1090312.1 hypothetical protein [Pseudomonas aeruginosa]